MAIMTRAFLHRSHGDKITDTCRYHQFDQEPGGKKCQALERKTLELIEQLRDQERNQERRSLHGNQLAYVPASQNGIQFPLRTILHPLELLNQTWNLVKDTRSYLRIFGGRL
nr:hypothetical protein [Mesorhizobium sp.]